MMSDVLRVLQARRVHGGFGWTSTPGGGSVAHRMSLNILIIACADRDCAFIPCSSVPNCLPHNHTPQASN